VAVNGGAARCAGSAGGRGGLLSGDQPLEVNRSYKRQGFTLG